MRASKRNLQANRKMRHGILFFVSMFFTTVYLVWRTLFTIPVKFGPLATVLGVLLLIAESMAALEALIQYRQIIKHMVPERPDLPDEMYPHVDILVATHNEDVEILYRTLNACNFLRYPDKRKVHVYLCDDNDRPEMAALAAQLGVGYFGLSGNKHAKAGNLNNALGKTDSPLVATFDSDMIPTSDFLLMTVPYFFLPVMKRDEATGAWVMRCESEIDPNYKVGFVQTPQSFFNPDLFQFNLFSETRIPNEQDYFFREVNVGRNADNGVIYAGSNTLLSRRALEEVGYIATTSITEDFLTGLRIQKKGYTTYAIPDELAHGLSPNTISALLKQRERWGRGCIQALRQEQLLTTRTLSFWTKLSYFATWSYWWAFARRMIYILSPIICILFNLPVMGVLTWQVLVFWLPHYFFGNLALKSFSNGVRNRHWSNVYDTIMFPYLVGPILFETLGVKKRKFVVTDKNRADKKRDLSPIFSLPHIEILIGSVLSLIVCVRMSIITNTIYSPIIAFWLVMNTKNILLAVFFMYGRKNFRLADRFYVEEDAMMRHDGREYHVKTSDVSETGIALQFPSPVYFPPETPIYTRVTYRDYVAEMTVDIIHVAQVGERWKYSVRIREIDEENRRRYMQIVYDRSHTMPRSLDATLSIFDDFNINITRRSGKSGQVQQSRYSARESSMRALPRICMNRPFTAGAARGTIVDFNFRYLLLRYDTPAPTLGGGELLRLDIAPGAVLYLRQLQSDTPPEKGILYRVVNADAFARAPESAAIIDAWLGRKQSDPCPPAVGTVVSAPQTMNTAEED